MVMIAREDFLSDPTGARFVDVVDDPRVDFQGWLDFFNDEARQVRMEDSESHHLRPALAGVIRELERTPVFERYFVTNVGEKTARGRQCIGVLVRMIMERRGWRGTGNRGSLGQRLKVTANADKPVTHNTSGLSLHFSKAEHYERV